MGADEEATHEILNCSEIQVLTGLPMDPPGMETSMTLLGGRTYTEPGGISCCAVSAPLIICCKTGTVGGTNVAPLTKNFSVVKGNWISRLIFTSATPGVGVPGAPGLVSG